MATVVQLQRRESLSTAGLFARCHGNTRYVRARSPRRPAHRGLASPWADRQVPTVT